MHTSKLLSAALSVITAVFILSVSVAFPILMRPFYYAHIDALGLEGTTGLTRTQIIQAYDQMMDFCTGRTEEFSTGSFPWSPSGRAHFVDVRRLFLLDLGAAALSGLLLMAWGLLKRKSPVAPRRFLGRCFAFWGSAGLLVLFFILALFAALDFEGTFLLFHALVFPGKVNWYFDPYTDGIIRILPLPFFRNCAILILALVVLQCVLCVLHDLRSTA